MNSKIIKLPSNQLYIFVFFYRLRKKKKRIKKKFFKKPLKYFLREKSILKNFNKKINKNFIEKSKNLFYLDYTKNFNSFKSIKSTNINYTNITNNSYFKNIKKNLINYYLVSKHIKNKKKLKKLLNKNNNNIFKLIKLNLIKYFLLVNSNILLNKIKLVGKQNNDNNIKLLKYKLHITFKKLNKVIKLINLLKTYNNNIILTNFIKNNYLKSFNKNYIAFLLYYINYKTNIKNNFNLNNKNYFNIKKYSSKKNIVINNKNNKNLIKKSKNIKIKEIKKFLSKLTNSKISIIFINSLSFAKFCYYLEQKNEFLKKSPNIFLNIQKQMLSSYRYDAIYIQDFVNIAFISLIFKNIQILTDFIGFQFKKLPKNKRQLKLIQLVTKTLQIIFKERDEISGLKIQFKGRINKRKRARTINFKDGVISLHSHSSRVEYGQTNAFTRSGSLGIKLWLFYNKNFKNELKRYFLNYIKYSKLKKNQINNVIKTKSS